MLDPSHLPSKYFRIIGKSRETLINTPKMAKQEEEMLLIPPIPFKCLVIKYKLGL
jgi:hypothetical protein